MCKVLPVECVSKQWTVNTPRCWTLWTNPAWKQGGKSKTLIVVQDCEPL